MLRYFNPQSTKNAPLDDVIIIRKINFVVFVNAKSVDESNDCELGSYAAKKKTPQYTVIKLAIRDMFSS